MNLVSSADVWFETHAAWPEAVARLRALVLNAGLDETLKWGQPTYVHEGQNVVMVSALKSGATLSFLKGALLHDPESLLLSPGKNSRHVRYLRFAGPSEVDAHRPAIEAFLHAAIALAQSGARVEPPGSDPVLVDELRERLDEDPELAMAFAELTPGRRRGYHLHIEAAKRPATRRARIERCRERILMGKGLHDCICGRSRRMPRCDGSHKKASITGE